MSKVDTVVSGRACHVHPWKIKARPMSAPGFVVKPRKFSTFEMALLIFASVFLLSAAVGGYVALHTNGAFEAIALVFLLILVGAIFAIIVGVRIIILIAVCRLRQRWLASSTLLACVALFMTFPFLAAPAVSYVIDQLRFHVHESFYVGEVEKSDSSPKFVVFDWGESGLAGSTARYLLVFDPENSMAKGLQNPADIPLPQCSFSALPLWGGFYSVAVHCEPK